MKLKTCLSERLQTEPSRRDTNEKRMNASRRNAEPKVRCEGKIFVAQTRNTKTGEINTPRILASITPRKGYEYTQSLNL